MIGQIAYVSITAGLSYTFAVLALKRRKRITLAIEQDAAPAFRDLLVESGLLFASGLFGLLAAFIWLSARRDIG